MINVNRLIELPDFVSQRMSKHIQELKEICEIPAPPFEEEVRAAEVERRMKELDLLVTRDTEGNVIGRYRGREATAHLVISAHLDTVFSKETVVKVEKRGDRLYAPGISDNAAGLAALLTLAGVLRDLHWVPPFDVIFLANVGEEGLGNLRGMRSFFSDYAARSNVKINAALVLDGVLGRVITRGIAVRRLKVTFGTMGGHSWLDFGSPSAVHSLVIAIAQVLEIPIPSQAKTTHNISMLSGGTAINAIAAEASAWLDLRSEDPATLARYQAEIKFALETTARKTGARLQIEIVGERPAGGIPDDHPLAQIASRAAKKLQLECILGAGSTDANIPLSLDIPSLTIGISEGSRFHTLEESLGIHSLEPGLLLAAEVLLGTVDWLTL